MNPLVIAVTVGMLLGGCAAATEYRLGDDGQVRKYVGKEIPGPGIRVLPPDKPKSQHDFETSGCWQCPTFLDLTGPLGPHSRPIFK